MNLQATAKALYDALPRAKLIAGILFSGKDAECLQKVFLLADQLIEAVEKPENEASDELE